VFRLGVPYKDGSARGLEYYLNMLRLLVRRLEALTGRTLRDDSLRQSIAAYNRMRGLLRQIGDLRKRGRLPISTLDFIKLNHASFHLDPGYMNETLAGLLESLEGHDGVASAGRPRLLLTGPNVADGDYKVLELIDECGGDIVVEELAEGVRYYRSDTGTDRDPLDALAVKYLRDRAPAAFMRLSASRRFDFVTGLAREFGAQGIVWYQLLYCDTYDIEFHYFERNLERLGLPMLRLESDYNVQDTGALKTRIEAFLETIGGATSQGGAR